MKLAHALLTVALVGALFYALWRAQPPRHVRIAAGPVGGSFYESGQRYKALMEERGYRVTVVPLQDTDEIGAKLDDARERFDIGFVAEDRESRGEGKWISLGDIQLQSIFIFENSRSAAAKPSTSAVENRNQPRSWPSSNGNCLRRAKASNCVAEISVSVRTSLRLKVMGDFLLSC